VKVGRSWNGNKNSAMSRVDAKGGTSKLVDVAEGWCLIEVGNENEFAKPTFLKAADDEDETDPASDEEDDGVLVNVVEDLIDNNKQGDAVLRGSLLSFLFDRNEHPAEPADDTLGGDPGEVRDLKTVKNKTTKDQKKTSKRAKKRRTRRRRAGRR